MANDFYKWFSERKLTRLGGARRERIERSRLAVLAQHASPPGDLLEVGPGAGTLVDPLRAAGWRYRAIEASPALAAALRERGVQVTQAWVPPFPVPDGLVASVSGALVSEISLPEIPGIQAFGIRAVPPGVPGDTNFDGQVDIKDLNNVRNNFGTGGPAVLGDTNGDGKINIEDLNMVRNNFGAGVNPAPEPGSFVLAAIGTTLIIALRRKSV